MPTPYERVERVGDRVAPPRIVRPRAGRWIVGVAAGVADHLGLPVLWVRVALVALSIFGGAGGVVYLFLWALTPTEGAGLEAVPARRTPRNPASRSAGAPPNTAASDGPEADSPSSTARLGIESSSAPLLIVGALVAVVGVLMGLQSLGLDVRSGVVIPLLAIGVGAIIAWSQLDAAARSRWLGEDTTSRSAPIARIGFGGLLAVVGVLFLVIRGRSLSAMWDAGLATIAVLLGVTLIAAPWFVRLVTDLRAEQVAAARATERADIAAHLHDSVLQTLALIQRKADDPAAVQRLARAQERELRSWLYAGPVGSQASLAAALTEAAHEVEDEHGIPIDLVVTGDRPLEADGTALAAAFREALLNAVRHGGPPVTAYAEVGAAGVEAFVRDRGEGFELEDIPDDRMGVRESIVRRLDRHGGHATVRRREDGTEVHLVLPALQGEPS